MEREGEKSFYFKGERKTPHNIFLFLDLLTDGRHEMTQFDTTVSALVNQRKHKMQIFLASS